MDAWVIKIGGSLASHCGLRGWLCAIRKAAGRRKLAVVAGGGIFAKPFKTLAAMHRLSLEDAHHLAIDGTGLYGRFLEALEPSLYGVQGFDEFDAAFGQGRPVLWHAAQCKNDAAVPASWDVTSDALAAFASVRLGAAALFFLKARAPHPSGMALAQLQGEGLLDRGTSLYAHDPAVWGILAADDIKAQDAFAQGDDAIWNHAHTITEKAA